MLIMLAMK